MAEFDRLMNQTKYKETLKQYFVLAESVDYGLNYGYAAVRAYTAYRDLNFLALTEQAAAGTIDVKQFSLSPTCQGSTLTGGTYFVSHAFHPHLAI
ncbi:hypothetical protein IW262DRAFT_1399989 [Armillaria fumosa]|nr:hypothetical protein IW262DRAFT_1399989 [Armillaria fumosa]